MSPPREGIIVALWTPTDERGNLLVEEFRAPLQFLLRKGVHGILPLDSTGEFLFFDPAQRKQFLNVIAENAGALPVIANISDIRPAVVKELARHCRELALAGVTLLTPYFFPVTQPDLVEFFVGAGAAAQLPLFLYNFPERTGNRIALETIAAVAERTPLAGVKQSGDEFDYHVPLVKLGRERNFCVLTGADTRLAEAMALGVTGCVSGLANAVPELMVEVFNGVRQNAPARAQRATEQMQAIGKLIGQVPFPLNVAATIKARGFQPGHPKAIVSSTTKARYQQLVSELRDLFREWKLG